MLMGSCIPRRIPVVGVLCLVLMVWIFWSSSIRDGMSAFSFSSLSRGPPLANATLGFGAIVATSMEDQSDPEAWRQRGMIAAANRTGLHIQIPPPAPAISGEDLERLMTAGKGPYPKEGSARAYWAHLKQLERFLASGKETMLLLEDDADWELDIRKLLAPGSPIVDGIRNSTGATQDPVLYPYGTEWDLLWLGHCGFESIHPEKKVVVPDQVSLPSKDIKPVVGGNLYSDMAEHTREIHPRVGAMCTFGIGMSRRWAEKVLAAAFKGGTKGVDYSTHVICKYGGMRCVGVLPEILHHQRAAGGGYRTAIQKINQAAYGENSPPPNGLAAGAAEDPDEPVHFFTMNLRYSARCNAFSTDRSRKTCLPSEKDRATYDT